MSTEKLEEFLSTPNTPDDSNAMDDSIGNLSTDDLLDNVCKEKNIDMSKPEVYISNTDDFFTSIQNTLKKSSESTKWKFKVTPKFHNKKIDGYFLTISKKFEG